MSKTRVAIDFDGTIVDHRYPDIGPFAPGALYWLRKWSNDPNVELILWTMRCSDSTDGDTLGMAAEHCEKNGIRFGERLNKADQDWTTSPKVYAHIYVDDMACGAPLIERADFRRPCIDWSIAGNTVQRLIDERATCDAKAIV